uniref:Uncharacterized protein n=1 Tax=Lotharella oceanica TaxID=641309 RepID=A0A7S2TPA2_9EUKA|mmetsp:Transcript_20664/g.38879  ORF Transcript_20664/g.38879 Transcript_20664/m.38879 type:complete len:191 (+) Transcript_20664:216-788(+)
MSKAQPINRKPNRIGGMVSVAHSCPTFGVPPRPPMRKPLQPMVEPPSLCLPSSPMFETEISRQSSSTSKGEPELSRSLKTYSGFSCPGVPSQFLISAGSAKLQPPKFSQNSNSTEVKLGSSPTVFELLKRRTSISGGNAQSRRYPGPSFQRNPAPVQPDMDDDLDGLQFDLTLDAPSESKNSASLHPSLT